MMPLASAAQRRIPRGPNGRLPVLLTHPAATTSLILMEILSGLGVSLPSVRAFDVVTVKRLGSGCVDPPVVRLCRQFGLPS